MRAPKPDLDVELLQPDHPALQREAFAPDAKAVHLRSLLDLRQDVVHHRAVEIDKAVLHLVDLMIAQTPGTRARKQTAQAGTRRFPRSERIQAASRGVQVQGLKDSPPLQPAPATGALRRPGPRPLSAWIPPGAWPPHWQAEGRPEEHCSRSNRQEGVKEHPADPKP